MSFPNPSAFKRALNRQNESRPPVWMMRQAGRYHPHYQALRQLHGFVDLCKRPELACETTMGPIRDFDFDAAILFSDLLFPLESLGMGLTYDPAPKLSWHLRTPADFSRFNQGVSNAASLHFQSDALKLIRAKLPSDKGLLGFVGSPWTLYVYAVEGSHKGGLETAIAGIERGWFSRFCDLLRPLLTQNLIDQGTAGSDAVAIFDTCAGDLDPKLYQQHVVPELSKITNAFRQKAPAVGLVYYSKGTTRVQWSMIRDLPIDCIGVDWRTPITEVLDEFGDRFAIQGNVDPEWLTQENSVFESKLRTYFEILVASRKRRSNYLSGWICGLGHGVTPQARPENVKAFVQIQREYFQ